MDPAGASTAQLHILFVAIDSATPARLRAVLRNISKNVPGAFPAISKELLLKKGELKASTPWLHRRAVHGIFDEDSGVDEIDYECVEDSEEEEVEEEFSEEDDDDDDEHYGWSSESSDYSDEEAGGERRRQRYEYCKHYKQEYDVLDNRERVCAWHDGYREVDWHAPIWKDHDEAVDGEIDDRMLHRHPEGFKWSCCDKPNGRLGCNRNRHKPNRAKRVLKYRPNPAKRIRIA